jgi:hypothetical protein
MGARVTERLPALLFDRVVEHSGLSRIFARGVIERACAQAKLEPARLRPHDIAKLLPHLRVVMGVYMTPNEVQERLLAISALGPAGRGGDGDAGPSSPRGGSESPRQTPSGRPPRDFASLVTHAVGRAYALLMGGQAIEKTSKGVGHPTVARWGA